MPCFFVSELENSNEVKIISEEEFHHIIHVSRYQTNDEIVLTNGKGILAKGIIQNIKKNYLSVLINKIEKKQKTVPHIALAFSLLKNKHDHLIVEKTTELGVKDFFPFISERTIRKKSSNTIEKFQKTIFSASKQCDNAIFPKINEIRPFPEIIQLIKQAGYYPILAYENESEKIIDDILEMPNRNNICVIIGPEGGFSTYEIELIGKNEIPVFSLGNHTLRAETAAISAISQLHNIFLKENRSYY